MNNKHIHDRIRFTAWDNKRLAAPWEGREALEADVQARGQELAASYRTCMDGFQRIVDLLTNPADRTYRHPYMVATTPFFTIGTASYHHLGSGWLTARVEAFYRQDGSLPQAVETIVQLDTGSMSHGIAREKLNIENLSRQDGTGFLSPRHTWAEEELTVTWEELGPRVSAAQETLTMLWDALADPVRNPTVSDVAMWHRVPSPEEV